MDETPLNTIPKHPADETMALETTVKKLKNNHTGSCVQRVVDENGKILYDEPIGRIMSVDDNKAHFADPKGDPKIMIFSQDIKSGYVGKWCGPPLLSL